MPTGVPPAEPVTSGKAKGSLVFGILALVCVGINFLPGLLGLILGILGVRDVSRSNGAIGGKGLAITGIVLSCVGFFCNCIALLVGIPGSLTVMEAKRKQASHNNLKQLGIAFHNYASTYQDKLPSPIMDAQKQAILSQRVQLLPYIEQDAMYREMILMGPWQPWDSSAYKPFLSRRPKHYDDPINPQSAENSNYRFFVGPNTIFSDPGYQSKYTIGNIPDGTSNTILAVGATDGVPWTKPEELGNTPGIAAKLGPPGRDYFLAAMCDGSVRMVKKTVSDKTLRNAIDPTDGNPLGSDW
jgi:hypothetical protein